MILNTLMELGEPLSVGDITNVLISIKGIGGGHEKTLQASVLTILHRHKKSGLVENTGKDARELYLGVDFLNYAANFSIALLPCQ